MRCTAYKVAPDDGLIQSETCRASNEKIKSNHKNFVHPVRLYTPGSVRLHTQCLVKTSKMTFQDSSTKIGTDLLYKFNAISTIRKVSNIQQAYVYCSHMKERQYNS